MGDRYRGGSSAKGFPKRNDRKSNESNKPQQQSRQSGSGGGGGVSSRDNRGSNGNAGSKLTGAAFSESELSMELPKKKFTGRCRLYVGNLPLDMQENELKELFTPHGDISECYISGKGFAFLRLDTRAHAESAKEALDGKSIRNRQIRVRFAVHGAAIKVKELAPAISNEILYLSFSAFGEVERAIHVVDEKGRPTGEGLVEFDRKTAASDAISQLREKVFLMTANSRPLQAEIVEPKDEEDGLCEKMLQKTPALAKERELGPRFAALNSFEYVFGQRWKQLYDVERMRRQQLEEELKEERRRLDADMEIAYEDYKAQLLREDLHRRHMELDRLEASRRSRMQQQMPMIAPSQQQMFMGNPQGMKFEIMNSDPGMVEGPIGRNPPTFGGQGGMRQQGGPPHTHQNNGGMAQQQHQMVQMSGSTSNFGEPDVRRLLQPFKDSPGPGGLLNNNPFGINKNPMSQPAGSYNAFIGTPNQPPPPARQPPPPPAPFRPGQNPMELPPEKRMRR